MELSIQKRNPLTPLLNLKALRLIIAFKEVHAIYDIMFIKLYCLHARCRVPKSDASNYRFLRKKKLYSIADQQHAYDCFEYVFGSFALNCVYLYFK